jgi:hypothetical protein
MKNSTPENGLGKAKSDQDEPPPLTKEMKTAWKTATKLLKQKDVAKKIEGVKYCAGDARFFREGGGLPLLMGFLTSAKVWKCYKYTLSLFSSAKRTLV